MEEGITILHYNNNNASDVLRKSSLEGAYEEMKSLLFLPYTHAARVARTKWVYS